MSRDDEPHREDPEPVPAGPVPAATVPAGSTAGRLPRETSLHRVIAFSDAVVAIAMTLLVLPLVGVAQSFDPKGSVATMLSDSYLEIISFAVSFLVVMRFWAGHRRLYDALADFDERLLSLNAWWLLGVVFLPFPTARLFTQEKLSTGSVLFYLLTLLGIGLAALGQSGLAWRHRAWIRPGCAPVVRTHLLTSVLNCAVFAVAALLALVEPLAGLLALILSAVVVRPLRRFTERSHGVV